MIVHSCCYGGEGISTVYEYDVSSLLHIYLVSSLLHIYLSHIPLLVMIAICLFVYFE